MSKLPDYHLETTIRIEPPRGKSRAYRIRYISPDTDNKWTLLRLPEIDLANELFKSGTVSAEHTNDKLKLILAAQYAHRDRKKKRPKIHSGNEKIVEAMWADKYNRRKTRNMKRPEDSKQQLAKAIEACGLLPIDTCDLEDLADHLDDTLGDNPNRLARRITWINSILQWLGRNKLQAVSRKRDKVRYLSEPEFKQVSAFIKDPTDLRLARIAFYTGARLGEIFFIQPRHIRKHTLWIELQMTDVELEDGTFKEDTPKNGLEREIFLHDEVREDVIAWSKVPMKERYKIRLKAFSRVIQAACAEVFEEDDPIRILTFRDLRHCCAIYLLLAGATMTEVAQQLGNSPDVCYRYYSGFELKKESVERMKRLVTPTTPLVIPEKLAKTLAKSGLAIRDGMIVKLDQN